MYFPNYWVLSQLFGKSNSWKDFLSPCFPFFLSLAHFYSPFLAFCFQVQYYHYLLLLKKKKKKKKYLAKCARHPNQMQIYTWDQNLWILRNNVICHMFDFKCFITNKLPSREKTNKPKIFRTDIGKPNSIQYKSPFTWTNVFYKWAILPCEIRV